MRAKRAAVGILVALALHGAVAWASLGHSERSESVPDLGEAKERLEREIVGLRARGIPVVFVDVDPAMGCVIVAFQEMKQQYVRAVREIVGYSVPVLFRELAPKRVLFGVPPAPVLKVCEAWNLLTEGFDYWVDAWPDAERGLLRVRLRRLDYLEMTGIMAFLGNEVPVEFEGREWLDHLYVGTTCLGSKELEEASGKLWRAGWTAQNDYDNGMLIIEVYDPEPRQGERIEAVRRIAGYDTPIVFVLTRRETPWPDQISTTPLAALERYLGWLNLPDVFYEIVQETENETKAVLFLPRDGGSVPIVNLTLRRENGFWALGRMSKKPVPSPARRLEVAGYLVWLSQENGTTILANVLPLAKNLDDEVAYIWRVEVELNDPQHSYHKGFATVAGGPRDGLIGPGDTSFLGPILPFGGWWPEGSSDSVVIPIDSVRGKTYTITITLKDGEGTILGENTFIHTFARRNTLIMPSFWQESWQAILPLAIVAGILSLLVIERRRRARRERLRMGETWVHL